LSECCYANGKNRRGWSLRQQGRYILLFINIFNMFARKRVATRAGGGQVLRAPDVVAQPLDDGL
jgi:hypothetical protein